MSELSIVLLSAALILSSGFGSIHSEIELIEGGGTEETSGDCGTILASVQMSRKQLDKMDDTVRSITPNLKDNIELGFFKLLEKLEHFIERKFDELDKKMYGKFQDTKTYMESKLTVIEDKISRYTSHIDSKITSLESTITHALNASDTLNNNNACCQVCLETAALLKNTSTNISDMDMRTLNMSARLHEMNKTIHNLSNLVVPAIENNISGLLNSTKEPAHNVSALNTTMAVKQKPSPSKCDRSQQEECCTAAVVGHDEYAVYTAMSASGRHTVVNMTSAGLQEYTMYFAVRGDHARLLLSSSSPYHDLYFIIGFYDSKGGDIFMYERLPTDSQRLVHDLYTSNIISTEHYTYYYVRISGDTLEVGRRGEPPLMIHTSTELRRLKYFSFTQWFEEGKALYDCTAE